MVKWLIAAALLFPIVACAAIPGKTRSEQAVAIDELVKRTLTDLETQSPTAQKEIQQSVGYAIMSNKLTKIPAVGVGSGYGVAIDNRTNDKTYLRMRRFDIGAGWGARSLRPVLIFQDAEVFQNFIDGKFEVRLGAEAAAKVGETGVAGGANGGGGKSGQKEYTAYVLTDAGVSATASFAVIRVKPVRLKK